MNWKDYFYFTKTERNGIAVLILIIIVVFFLPSIYALFFKHKKYDFAEFERKVKDHDQRMEEFIEARDALERAESFTGNPHRQIVLSPFLFNPNDITEQGWLAMGMPDRISRNIMNYLNAGGMFRYKEDLSRIYSISDELYNQLEPYIDLPSRGDVRAAMVMERSSSVYFQGDKRNQPINVNETDTGKILVELNTADTTSLQLIRGIGPAFSRRIVAYRDLLGGYQRKEQLLEVFGMDTTRYSQIMDQVEINELLVNKIDINNADFGTLVRHPYLNPNQVNSILRMRELHGPYGSVSDIKKSALINDSIFRKIEPYLMIAPLP